MSLGASPTRRLGGGGHALGSAFSPLAVPGLAAYYDGSVATRIAGKVSAWPDQGPSGDAARIATQADASLRPTYTAVDAGYNGQATLTFTGSSYLSTTTWNAALVQPTTFYVVGEVPADNAGNTLFDSNDLMSRQLLLSTPNTAGTHVELHAGATLDGGPITVAPHVIAVGFFGNLSTIYVDNATTPLATGAGGAQGFPGLMLGILGDGSTNPLNGGKEAAVAIYSGAHTPALRSTIMRWLGARYGIAVTP